MGKRVLRSVQLLGGPRDGGSSLAWEGQVRLSFPPAGPNDLLHVYFRSKSGLFEYHGRMTAAEVGQYQLMA